MFFAVNDDLSALVKHKRHTAGGSNITGALGKSGAHIGCSAVLVICQCVHDHGDTIGAVPLVGIVLIVDIADITRGLLDSALDRVIGNIVGFCLLNDLGKFVVVGRIRSAFLDSNGDFSADDRKDLALRGIVFLFFMFDICIRLVI